MSKLKLNTIIIALLAGTVAMAQTKVTGTVLDSLSRGP